MDFKDSNRQEYLSIVIDQSRSTAEQGGRPFAAMLVVDGQVLAEAVNDVARDGDVTQHAELRLVSNASKDLSRELLARSTLYSSTEPCVMCAGAIHRAGIRRVVFGCSAESLAEIVGADLIISCREIFNHGSEESEVEGPLLEQEALDIHRRFYGLDQVSR